jgi:prepilin-type N-terminal cleavage/methylation domain-containing protein
MCSTVSIQRKSSTRRGFTLLEVLLALTILLFSLAALANLSFVGVKAATRGQLQSEASWHANTVLEEIAAGIRKSVTTRPRPIEAGSDWIVAIRANAGEIPGLKFVEVQVWKSGSNPEHSRIQLTKMIYDRETPNE